MASIWLLSRYEYSAPDIIAAFATKEQAERAERHLAECAGTDASFGVCEVPLLTGHEQLGWVHEYDCTVTETLDGIRLTRQRRFCQGPVKESQLYYPRRLHAFGTEGAKAKATAATPERAEQLAREAMDQGGIGPIAKAMPVRGPRAWRGGEEGRRRDIEAIRNRSWGGKRESNAALAVAFGLPEDIIEKILETPKSLGAMLEERL